MASQQVPQRLLGHEFGPEGLVRVRVVVEGASGANRNEIARRVCKSMGWNNAAGAARLMSARAGLLKLHRAGLIQLPAPRHRNGNGRRRNSSQQRVDFSELWPMEQPMQCRIDELGPLWLRLVSGGKDSAQYYALLERYHYLGAKLGGAPHLLRYVFGVEERLLGVIGFGPAAWKVAARDRFLGWEHHGPGQPEALKLILNNLRFLILPWVRCGNLASQLLSRCARRVPQDFSAHYGYAPVLLETFVERERFLGSCYRAANWLCVGQTRGRGKRDRFHQANLGLKAVWLYPLRRDFRQCLRASSTAL